MRKKTIFPLLIKQTVQVKIGVCRVCIFTLARNFGKGMEGKEKKERIKGKKNGNKALKK